MKIRVLGAGAGGGFPQWNCNCNNCRRIRRGEMNGKPRSQSSIAVSTDHRNWLLINASPDIRAQLEAFPAIQPQQGVRDRHESTWTRMLRVLEFMADPTVIPFPQAVR